MRRVITVVVAALLFVPVIMKSRKSLESPDFAAFRSFSGDRVVVKVAGDVLHAGVYELPVNSMAVTVIKMAVPVGALKDDCNDSLRRPLANGSAVLLHMHPDGFCRVTTDIMSVSERMLLRIPLDISAMTEADFELLPGIGPGLARKITTYRQNNGGIIVFKDLLSVDGIGEKKYKMIRDFF